MFVNLKDIFIVVLVLFGALSPCISANMSPELDSAISKIFLLILGSIATIAIKKLTTNQVKYILKSCAFVFFIYLLFQSVITIYSADSSINIARASIIHILTYILIFLISASFSAKLPHKTFTVCISWVLALAFVSLLLDAMGFGDAFAGKYANILPERYGFRQLHGFMPWPNAMATLLVVYSLLLSIIGSSNFSTKFGYILTLTTMVRAHIVTAIFLLFLNIKSNRLKLFFVFIVVFVAIKYLSVSIQESMRELSYDNAESVYRLSYVMASAEVLKDYPFWGVGLNRLSNRGFWKRDNFKFHNKYYVPTELFNIEMNTSDTNITFFAEIGMLGIVLYVAQLFYFVKLSLALGCKNYIYIVFLQLLWAYSFPTMLFSYSYGSFYWILYGNLIARSYENKKCLLLNNQKLDQLMVNNRETDHELFKNVSSV